MTFSRRELLRRAAALVVATRVPWAGTGSAATSPRETLAALVDFVVGDRRLVPVTTRRLVHTLDRFLPGPQRRPRKPDHDLVRASPMFMGR